MSTLPLPPDGYLTKEILANVPVPGVPAGTVQSVQTAYLRRPRQVAAVAEGTANQLANVSSALSSAVGFQGNNLPSQSQVLPPPTPANPDSSFNPAAAFQQSIGSNSPFGVNNTEQTARLYPSAIDNPTDTPFNIQRAQNLYSGQPLISNIVPPGSIGGESDYLQIPTDVFRSSRGQAGGGSNIANGPTLFDQVDNLYGQPGFNTQQSTNPNQASRVIDQGELDSNPYRVRLVSAMSGSLGTGATVEFLVTPELSESRTVEYTSLVPLHMPGRIEVYKNTNSRTFSIQAKFVSRNSIEATTNAWQLQLLRSWQMPWFGLQSATGQSTGNATINQGQTNTMKGRVENPIDPTQQQSTQAKTAAAVREVRRDTLGRRGLDIGNKELLGAPPEVLYLYAYSPVNTVQSNGERVQVTTNLNQIPVVITSLNFTYPSDCDYIKTVYNEPFPILMNVTIELKETHSPTEYERFSLLEYRAGNLPNF